jgi:dihydroorotate dehydrogenase
MIYAGPSLPGRIVSGLSTFLDREGLSSLSSIRDTRVAHWAARPIA